MPLLEARKMIVKSWSKTNCIYLIKYFLQLTKKLKKQKAGFDKEDPNANLNVEQIFSLWLGEIEGSSLTYFLV